MNARRHVTLGAGCSLAAVLLTACATAAPAVTAHDVLLERQQAIEGESLRVFEAFLAENADRLDEVGLPQPTFQGVIEPERWGEAVIGCVESLDPDLSVSRQEGGFGVNYFQVPDATYERIRWTIESCMVQYGVPTPASPAPGPVELAWMRHDETHRWLPCWRSLGFSVPPSSSAAAARAEPLCPSTAVELQRQLELAAGEP